MAETETAPVSSVSSEPAPAASPIPEEEVSPYKQRSIAECIDEEKTVRVVTLSEPMENTFTEHDLRRWSLNFERPTVVRGLFTPPKLDSLDSCEYFLPKKTKVFANVGQIGHFQVFTRTHIHIHMRAMNVIDMRARVCMREDKQRIDFRYAHI